MIGNIASFTSENVIRGCRVAKSLRGSFSFSMAVSYSGQFKRRRGLGNNANDSVLN